MSSIPAFFLSEGRDSSHQNSSRGLSEHGQLGGWTKSQRSARGFKASPVGEPTCAPEMSLRTIWSSSTKQKTELENRRHSALILLSAVCSQPSVPHPRASFVDYGLLEIAAATLKYFRVA